MSWGPRAALENGTQGDWRLARCAGFGAGGGGEDAGLWREAGVGTGGQEVAVWAGGHRGQGGAVMLGRHLRGAGQVPLLATSPASSA